MQTDMSTKYSSTPRCHQGSVCSMQAKVLRPSCDLGNQAQRSVEGGDQHIHSMSHDRGPCRTAPELKMMIFFKVRE